jgi:hypothetical protein
MTVENDLYEILRVLKPKVKALIVRVNELINGYAFQSICRFQNNSWNRFQRVSINFQANDD